MYFIYIDDSGENGTHIYTALAIPEENWNESFRQIRNFRIKLRDKHGIPIRKELHSWKLVSGRGRISSKIINKSTRIEIFNEILSLTASLPGIKIFLSCNKNDDYCFERLLNRIERTMKELGHQAIIFSDHGKDNIFKKTRRRMAIANNISSKQEVSENWLGTGDKFKNIPLVHIVEDIVFKDSAHCCFIQLADACAYSLLRKENPLQSKNKLGLGQSFNNLDNNDSLALKGIVRDPMGIIR